MFKVKSKRGRAGAKRLDVGQVKDALRDRRLWSGLGVVRLFPGEIEHFSIETGDEPDVLVDVELMPNRERLVCRLGIAVGAVWRVPPVDSEVALLIPQGDLEADPIIVGVISEPPGLLTGSNVVIMAPAGGTVEIYDGSGTPKELAYKEDLEAFKTVFDAHTHVLTVAAASGSGGTGTAAIPATPAPAPAGTTVLKAK